MTNSISTAMILAAGLGTRMRPLTDTLPKPLVPVKGKPLIDYALDRFAAAGVERAIVNAHYRAAQIEQHLEKRVSPEIVISDERDLLLETGGALIKAQPHFGGLPFFCTNTDAILIDNQSEACYALSSFWRDADMDALLLLCRPDQASGYGGTGDFHHTEGGRLTWPGTGAEPGEPLYIFTGLQIVHPRLFADEPLKPVSTRNFWDKAMKQGRLYGVPYDGYWMHVGDPASLAHAEQRLSGL